MKFMSIWSRGGRSVILPCTYLILALLCLSLALAPSSQKLGWSGHINDIFSLYTLTSHYDSQDHDGFVR
jgi:hypothetical protein